jgi:hypothetical protein
MSTFPAQSFRAELELKGMGKSTKTKTALPASPATAPKERTLKPHEVVLSPTIQSAVGVHAWSKFAGEGDLAELVDDLREQVKQVQGGDLSRVEAMLYGQAVTLQTIFTSLARKAVAQEYLKQFQVNLTLALKAQAQCRATLQALAEIKNPRPVSFVQQANIANGPQQVNNGPAKPDQYAQAHAHAGKTEDARNELLEHQHGHTLDTGAQAAPSGANSTMEAVAARKRPANP